MRYILLFIVLGFVACGSNDSTAPEVELFYAPAPGTIIAADSMRIIEDQLNELYYSTVVIATEESDEGKYTLLANYGYNEAKTEIRFPELTRALTPAIRPDTAMRYSYIIGFKYDDENTFNDYIRIFAKRMTGVETQIELRYLKAYYVDSVSKK